MNKRRRKKAAGSQPVSITEMTFCFDELHVHSPAMIRALKEVGRSANQLARNLSIPIPRRHGKSTMAGEIIRKFGLTPSIVGFDEEAFDVTRVFIGLDPGKGDDYTEVTQIRDVELKQTVGLPSLRRPRE